MFVKSEFNKTTNKYESKVADNASEIVNLQEKTVTENGEVTPDEGYDGLSKVTVNVSGESVDLEDNKSVTIQNNGTIEILPTEGKDGMAKVTAKVYVEELPTTAYTYAAYSTSNYYGSNPIGVFVSETAITDVGSYKGYVKRFSEGNTMRKGTYSVTEINQGSCGETSAKFTYGTYTYYLSI